MNIRISSEELFSLMDDETRKKIEEAIFNKKPNKNTAIIRLKEFIDQYQDDHMLDLSTAAAIAHLIDNIIQCIEDEFDGDHELNLLQAMEVTKEALKKTIKNINKALDDHAAECTTCNHK